MNYARKQQIKRALVALAVLTPVALFGLWFWGHIFYSLTNSLAYDLFWLRSCGAHDDIPLGTYVEFAAPREYSEISGLHLPGSAKALKRLACKEGQDLQYRDRKFYCNGHVIAETKDISMSGKRLSAFAFNGTIPRGKLFVVGDSKDSYDSRYIGFLDRPMVLATARPLI